MAVENSGVPVVEDGCLDWPTQQGARVAHEELVERVVGGDENCKPEPPPSRSTPLLPQACDGPWKPDRDRAIEQPDVDTQLERARRGNTKELAIDEPLLDVTALLGCVAGAIRGEAPGEGGVEPLARDAVDDLRRPPALGEHDRPQTAGDELCEQPTGVTERARTQPELRIDELRVPEANVALASRNCGSAR